MIFKKPDVIIKKPWDRNKPQVYLLDEWGVTTSDKVVLPMRSGKQMKYKITSFQPITEARVDDKVVQSKWRGKSIWLADIKAEGYLK